MDRTQKIIKLTNNKDKKVNLMFNNDLWELFKEACESENLKPTPKLEILILDYIESKGLL